MSQWYEKHGLSEDPFSTDPADFPDSLTGYERALEELAYHAEAGGMVFLKGEPGSGKTAMLFRLMGMFPRQHVVYVDCAKLPADINIIEVAKERGSFLRRLFNRMPHKAILLLDNVHNLSTRNNERIKNLYDMDVLKSVVFAGDGFTKASFSKSLRERISSVVVLEPLAGYQAVQLARKRFPQALLTDRAIVALFQAKAGNIREFLKGCGAVCAYATSRGLPSADEYLVRDILGTGAQPLPPLPMKVS
ncbi:ATP-binding protein [Candidatus Woesearchaeota archaeon]|nr:ATP-binding protein [Candidatus Woesearchaeota archaeon]